MPLFANFGSILFVLVELSQVVVKLGKHWRDALENTSNHNIQAQGFGGTDPSTGLFAYCFSDLWLSMNVQKEQ